MEIENCQPFPANVLQLRDFQTENEDLELHSTKSVILYALKFHRGSEISGYHSRFLELART